MKVSKEIFLCDFKPWAGAKENFNLLTLKEMKIIEEIIEDLYPDGISETELNDILWFDDEFIADCLGYKDYEDFYISHKKPF